MPKVIGHTPTWLSQPSPGARIFSDPEAQPPASPSKRQNLSRTNTDPSGPTRASKRLIAHRGSEIFTVVGNKIRWADLARVKDQWEAQSHRRQQPNEIGKENVYRTFKTPVYYQITSISISPSGHFLAIATEHSVHVAIVPDSNRLHDADPAEIKLKTYQIGPTTHVIPEAPLAGVLWHPLAVASASTDCLVTVTTDAAVRLWELERSNHWSFERPALAIDLRKLADGTSSDQDFEPSGFGKSRGFSADVFDMEASAVCFGGAKADGEDPWASMTLWTSMTNGDVYALCPLLPSKWTSSPTTIPALTTSAVARLASMPTGIEADEQMAANQRYEWVQELDNEAFQLDHGTNESVRLRPSNPSAIPRLQGPFELPIELDDDVEACDILIIPANLDEEDIFSGEDDYEIVGGSRSLPFSVICLATTDEKIHIMIELDGVTGQWLPKRGRSSFSMPTRDAGEFVLLETINVANNSQVTQARLAFTPDTANPYEFFVTTKNSILSISLEDWASRVGGEVADDTEVGNGLQSRLALACHDSIAITQTLLDQQSASFSTGLLIDEINIGTILLTSTHTRAVAAQLDQSSFRTSKLLANDAPFSTSMLGRSRNQSTFRTSQSLMQVLATDNQSRLDTPPTREPYSPPQIFYENHMAPVENLRSRVPIQYRHVLSQSPMQMSPVCLGVMTTAHRVLSDQTSRIERAVAELFRRFERLRQELTDQVEQMAKLAERLQQIKSGNDQDDSKTVVDENTSHDEQISNRIAAAHEKQKELFARYERVRKRAAQVQNGNKAISTTEKTWINEIGSLAVRVGVDTNDTTPEDHQSLSDRLDAAKKLSEELTEEAKRLKETTESESGKTEKESGTPTSKLRSSVGGVTKFQRERIREVMEMVEREGMVIEAVRGRLANLGVEA